MSTKNGFDPLDPMASMREMRDSMMDTWAKLAVEAVNTDTFAQMIGAYLNSTLAITGPMQKAVDQSMQSILPRLSLPSRDELTTLAGRLTNIEMRLDDMENQLYTIADAVTTTQKTQRRQAESKPLETHFASLEERLDKMLAALGQANSSASAGDDKSTSARPKRASRSETSTDTEVAKPEESGS